MLFRRKEPSRDLDVETALEKLKLRVASLDLTVEELAGRIKRLYSGQRRDKEHEDVSPQEEPTEPTAAEDNGPASGFLTARQRAIQQQILRRRAGL